ncbi:hypothetical protein D0Z07_6471 [Hyphodiscus hymeniophilus]|uniref:Sulfotransferase n=1 Tax=Hyphodiscus hymeniophilus TaxID=353542 RepID=A0A9P7AV23_9HELO|nr:hypothetical protein D0Z07_6471 [Hyphodiscus hymeniophilus]
MEILCLGLCRTATQSLADALEVLGYNRIYHMREVFKNQHGQYWISALEAKYEKKDKPFGREEFDQFLGDYAGVSDIPAALFYEELIDAYPEAKIILTTRDEDKWFESMKATVWHLHESRKAASAKGIPYRLSELQYEHVWGGDPDTYGRAKYREHNERLRSIAPNDRFLEYQVQEGWQPLCSFLNKEVPTVPFPRSDDWAEYKKENATKP